MCLRAHLQLYSCMGNANSGDNYICDYCGKCFSNKCALTFHIKRNSDNVCRYCNLHFVRKQKVGVHMQRRHHSPLVCQSCNIYFHAVEHLYCLDDSHRCKGRFILCNLCGERFDTKPRMLKHIQAHHGEILCRCCYKKCNNDDEFGSKFIKRKVEGYDDRKSKRRRDAIYSKEKKLYTRVSRGGVKSFKCTTCGCSYKVKRYLERHLRKHASVDIEKPFVCERCGKGFAYKDYLKNHYKRTLCGLAGIEPFSCDRCNKEFYHKGNLRNHFKRSGCGRPSPHGYISGDRENLTYNAVGTFTCDTCGRDFPRRGYILSHLKRSRCGQLFINDFNGRCVLLKDFLRQNSTTVSENEMKCNVCQKNFSAKDHLRGHLLRHLEEKYFLCDTCGQKFRRKAKLDAHVFYVHNEVKNVSFQCEVCGKSFGARNNYQNHMRTHSAEKRYGCEVCGKRFHFGYKLKRHKISHTGKRSFQCDICGKSYVFQSALKDHMTGHSDQSPYPCNVCGKTFILLSYLRDHMKSHNDTKSSSKRSSNPTRGERNSFLGGGGGNKWYLKNRVPMNTVVSGTMFSCYICGESFASKQRVMYHLRVHGEESGTLRTHFLA